MSHRARRLRRWEQYMDARDGRRLLLPGENALDVLGGPRAQADYFKRYDAIETFLMGAINYTLTAPADFLQQLVVAEVC